MKPVTLVGASSCFGSQCRIQIGASDRGVLGIASAVIRGAIALCALPENIGFY